MATAAPKKQLASSQTPRRPPLLPAESDNAPPRIPKTREIASRYLSSNSSNSSTPATKLRPSQSSVIAGMTPPRRSVGDRAVSSERQRFPATPSSKTTVRSLSVSFQGESYSMSVSKVKASPMPGGLRRATPVGDRRENQRHLWPGKLRDGENSNFMTQSLDSGSEIVKLRESRASTVNELRKSMDESGDSDVGGVRNALSSDGESAVRIRGGTPLGIVVPSRIWENSVNRTPVFSPRRDSTSKRSVTPRGSVRSASPNRTLNSSSGSLSRGMASPMRIRDVVRNSLDDSNSRSIPSVSSFAADVRRGKLGEDRISDALELRLLHNKQLQWRLANARLENTMLVQKQEAERTLVSAWLNTSKLRHSVTSQRIELQSLKQNIKLYSILKEQEPLLENWDMLDRDHCTSVSGAIEALQTCTTRLPLLDGAKADPQRVKEAICSASDVMQATESLVQTLVTEVEPTSVLASELANLAAREKCLLAEYNDLMQTFIPLQVRHSSLTANVLQLKREMERQG